jgi:hypothetical protein
MYRQIWISGTNRLEWSCRQFHCSPAFTSHFFNVSNTGQFYFWSYLRLAVFEGPLNPLSLAFPRLEDSLHCSFPPAAERCASCDVLWMSSSVPAACFTAYRASWLLQQGTMQCHLLLVTQVCSVAWTSTDFRQRSHKIWLWMCSRSCLLLNCLISGDTHHDIPARKTVHTLITTNLVAVDATWKLALRLFQFSVNIYW